MCIKLGTTKHQACAGPIDQQYAGEEKKKLWKKYKKKKKKRQLYCSLQVSGEPHCSHLLGRKIKVI